MNFHVLPVLSCYVLIQYAPFPPKNCNHGDGTLSKLNISYLCSIPKLVEGIVQLKSWTSYIVENFILLLADDKTGSVVIMFIVQKWIVCSSSPKHMYFFLIGWLISSVKCVFYRIKFTIWTNLKRKYATDGILIKGFSNLWF